MSALIALLFYLAGIATCILFVMLFIWWGQWTGEHWLPKQPPKVETIDGVQYMTWYVWDAASKTSAKVKKRINPTVLDERVVGQTYNFEGKMLGPLPPFDGTRERTYPPEDEQ
jgi:hypothetical protein